MEVRLNFSFFFSFFFLFLFFNIKFFLVEHYFLFRCLKELGIRHPFFVSSLVPELLVTHPFYAVPEPNINDSSHIAIAALVFNAAEKCPSIYSLLPSYTNQHREYLRDSLPYLIPQSKDKKEFTTGAFSLLYNELIMIKNYVKFFFFLSNGKGI